VRDSIIGLRPVRQGVTCLQEIEIISNLKKLHFISRKILKHFFDLINAVK